MYTYIIVDDEPIIRKGTIKKIGDFGGKITCSGEASNGKEGLLLIERLNPDIIITDMNMPISSGEEFLPLIRERYSEKHIIVISGYKDFTYAKHAISAQVINYILKPFSKEAIRESVKKAIALIEADLSTQNRIVSMEEEKEFIKFDYDIQMLKNLILGYQTTNLSFGSERVRLMTQTHNLCLMTIHRTQPIMEDSIHDYAANNELVQLGLYLSHLHNDNLCFFILLHPKNTFLQLDSICEQVAKGFISLLQNGSLESEDSISIGISQPKTDLLQLNMAYKETIEALNSMSKSDHSHYYFYTANNKNLQNLNWSKCEEFLFRIEAGETEKIDELVDDLFFYFSTIPDCRLYDVKCYCIELMQKTRSILSHYFENVTSDNISSSVQNIFNTMFDYDEMKLYFHRFFFTFAASMKNTSIYSSFNTIEKLKTYIRRNYWKDLSMEFLSSLFYINRSYCSHTFKEKTGENFVDYVNRIRTEQAQLLLKQSNKKMYQISKSVGYENVKYFFRIFKKMTGQTPEEYRNSL